MLLDLSKLFIQSLLPRQEAPIHAGFKRWILIYPRFHPTGSMHCFAVDLSEALGRSEVKLTRFHGHLILTEEGVQAAATARGTQRKLTTLRIRTQHAAAGFCRKKG